MSAAELSQINQYQYFNWEEKMEASAYASKRVVQNNLGMVGA
jgi:hypothetical protein